MALARRAARRSSRPMSRASSSPSRAMPAAEAERIYAGSMAIRDAHERDRPGDPAIAGLTVAAWLDRQPDRRRRQGGVPLDDRGLVVRGARTAAAVVSDRQRPPHHQRGVGAAVFPAETMHSLADDLAGDLGDRLRLEHAGEDASSTARTACASSSPTGVGRGRAALVAVPPMMASRLDFAPPLPAGLRTALGVWQSGSGDQGAGALSPRAFWRERGLSGMVMWRDPPGLFACDASKDDGHPTLVVFVGGPLALRWRGLGEPALRAEVTARLAAALGPEAGDIHRLQLRDWTRRPLERRRLQRSRHRHRRRPTPNGMLLRRRAAGAFRRVGAVAVFSGLYRRRDRRRAHRGGERCICGRFSPPSPPARRGRRRGGSARRPGCRRRRNRWFRRPTAVFPGPVSRR